MRLLNEVAPCARDCGWVSVVGCVVDEKADIKVASLVGIIVEELSRLLEFS